MNKVDIVIPVLNEEFALSGCVENLLHFAQTNLESYDCKIVIADNGSHDATLDVAQKLSVKYGKEKVIYFHMDQRGRGRALRKAWLESESDVLVYMDVDLSTNLKTLPELIFSITNNNFDLAVGSRLKSGSKTTRSVKRELISRTYNVLIKILFQTRFSDAQCGFKAISKKAASQLIPLVENNHWFFDTELLILAERTGFKIKDIPVEWEEDSDTRVKIMKTVLEDLRGLARLRFSPTPIISRERAESRLESHRKD